MIILHNNMLLYILHMRTWVCLAVCVNIIGFTYYVDVEVFHAWYIYIRTYACTA